MNQKNIHSVLETQNLSIGYRDKKQVYEIQKNLNLKIHKGALLAVLGRNGIGKSTLLRTLTKVQSPLNGSIAIDGKELQNFDFKELSQKVSVVLTERLPDSQLTVFELVALGRQPYTNWLGKLSEDDILKVQWALQQTECEEFSHKHFYELSDGQLQRVMIARALAQDTEIIILDEPTAHLDMHHTIKIFQLLQKLVLETQKTIILSTHEVNLAIQLADQFVLMTEQEVASGDKETLIKTNTFHKLFPSEILNFNTNLEQFVIRKKSPNKQ
jgi:iron complex transport system ATP-binding protein